MAKKYKSEVMNFMEAIKGKHFFVIDTETTGFKASTADVIEFSAIKVNGDTFEIMEEFDTFVNPGYPLPREIVEFNEKNGTGICDAVLSKAPDTKTAAKRIIEFMGESPIVMGHNSIRFDSDFIDKMYHSIGEFFTPSIHIDTLIMSKELVEGSHKLCDLFAQTDASDAVGFHTSIADVKATLEVFKWMLPMYDKPEVVATINITRIQRWTKSHTLDRLYVNTSANDNIYYDVYKMEWCTTLDHSAVENAVLHYTGMDSISDVLKKYVA